MENKYSKLKTFLGEYFLGTKIKIYERNKRNVYREFVTDPQDLKTLLDSSKTWEKVNIYLGKAFFSVFDIGLLVTSAITKNPDYLVGIPISEAARMFVNHLYKNSQEDSELCIKVLKHSCSALDAVENLVEKIKEEREEL